MCRHCRKQQHYDQGFGSCHPWQGVSLHGSLCLTISMMMANISMLIVCALNTMLPPPNSCRLLLIALTRSEAVPK